MIDSVGQLVLTPSLEDYLETIYQVIRDHKVARVRDIAKSRGVKAGSVTPALRRLQDLGLIEYHRREFIDLTKRGESEARRVLARHQVLASFFGRVLKMPGKEAEENACAMEHHLSDLAMDRMVRFIEFMGHCPDGLPGFLEKFQESLDRAEPFEHYPCDHCATSRTCKEDQGEVEMSLSEVVPGASARVAQVNSQGAVRQRLLDMGFLPNVSLTVERVGPGGDPVWVKLQGFQISLRRQEADAIRVLSERG